MRLRIGLSMIVLALLVLSIPALNAQDATAPDATGQVLAISTLPRLIPTPTIQDYIDAFKVAHEAGISGDHISEPWSKLEPAAGQFQLDDLVNGILYVTQTYNYTIQLNLQVLNTTTKETPPDLLDVPFDDPRMVERFKALIDALLPHLTPNVRYLAIGNEVDVYLEAHPDEWTAYTAFYEQALAYVHQVAPWIQVGVTTTYSNPQNNAEAIHRLNARSDVYILTYYPTAATLEAISPEAPLTDFPRMVEFAAGLPVILQEVGYPSAELLGSSEAEQVEFVQNVFAAWKSAGSAIPFLNYFLLHDFSEALCDGFEAYYGVKFDRFHAFLCSLGLRQADGTPKLAWDTFVQEGQRWQAGTP